MFKERKLQVLQRFGDPVVTSIDFDKFVSLYNTVERELLQDLIMQHLESCPKNYATCMHHFMHHSTPFLVLKFVMKHTMSWCAANEPAISSQNVTIHIKVTA